MDIANIVNTQQEIAKNRRLSAVLAAASMRDVAKQRISDEDAAATRALGQRVERAAKIRGVSLNSLDDMVKQTRGQTSRLVAGHRKSITAALATRYALALRVRLDWLREGTGEMDVREGEPSAIEAAVRATLAQLAAKGDLSQARENAQVGIDNLEVAVRWHRGAFAPEIVAAVREAALAAGIEIATRHPDQWAIELRKEERRRAPAAPAKHRRGA